MKHELDSATIQLALARLSRRLKSQFSNILPFELLTISGALMSTAIRNRNTTLDDDVSHGFGE
jgi:hypothetical protein